MFILALICLSLFITVTVDIDAEKHHYIHSNRRLFGNKY